MSTLETFSDQDTFVATVGVKPVAEKRRALKKYAPESRACRRRFVYPTPPRPGDL